MPSEKRREGGERGRRGEGEKVYASGRFTLDMNRPYRLVENSSSIY